MMTALRSAFALAATLACTTAFAWGPDGHHTVGALADRLLEGSHAQAQVKALLGELTLRDAAVWADCAKGVDPAKDYTYTSAGKYPECAVFETPEGEAAMIDYVRRNDTNCPRAAGSESCHKQYHYTDEAIQRRRYHLGDAGTSEFDLVAAVTACLHVLRGEPSPKPFDIKDPREALLLLVHYVGDIAQPLHVGAVYLDESGHQVDPDHGADEHASSTAGGNTIVTIRVATNHRSENLHSTWDAIPESLNSRHIGGGWLAAARAVKPTRGAMDGWSAAWADETLAQARAALGGLAYRDKHDNVWTVPLDGRYDDSMAPVKRRQLTLGGA